MGNASSSDEEQDYAHEKQAILVDNTPLHFVLVNNFPKGVDNIFKHIIRTIGDIPPYWRFSIETLDTVPISLGEEHDIIYLIDANKENMILNEWQRFAEISREFTNKYAIAVVFYCNKDNKTKINRYLHRYGFIEEYTYFIEKDTIESTIISMLSSCQIRQLYRKV